MTEASTNPAPGDPAAKPRYAAIDAARGVAIAAMVIYHAVWDADFLGLAPPALFTGWGWEWFRFAILGSFLFLVGVGLQLGHGQELRAKAFVRRFLLVAGGAALVTAASMLAFPQHVIVFGVLHNIAVSSVLALAFLRLPWTVTALAAAAAIAAGQLVVPIFDTPLLGWIGFMETPPASRDFVPLAPWFGVVLAGVAVARLGAPGKGLARWQPRLVLGRLLVLAGRRSLAIYLLHQPLIFLVLMGIAALALPQGHVSWSGGGALNSAAYGRSFGGACRRNCVAGGLSAAACAAYCQCMLNAVRRELAAADLNPKTITPRDRARLQALGRQCLKRPFPQGESPSRR